LASPTAETELLARLAADWRRRLRQGEKPALSEYTQQYPEFADRLRERLPGLVAQEELRADALAVTGDYVPPPDPGGTPGRLGDFRILREVGRGGMGIVYEAEQESLGRRVALKVLPAGARLDASQRLRFQREARAAARLHHTNIVPAFGVGEHEGQLYYVMQFIAGRGLDHVTVLTGSEDNTARLWSVRPPLEADASSIDLWLAAVTGLALDEHHAIRMLDERSWRTSRERLLQLPPPVSLEDLVP
jgi:hypothetical protein